MHNVLYRPVYLIVLAKRLDIPKLAFEPSVVLYQFGLDCLRKLPIVPLSGEVFLEIFLLCGEKRVAVTIEAGEYDVEQQLRAVLDFTENGFFRVVMVFFSGS